MAAYLDSLPYDVILIMLPLIAGMMAFLLPAAAKHMGIASAVFSLLSVIGLYYKLDDSGVFRRTIGGWNAPLGIELYIDGLSLLMLGMTAIVALAISVYSLGYFSKSHDHHRFWPVWLLLLGALNALFLTADIFNLYVTLELMGLSAVTLTALTRTKGSLVGATRYLFATLLGSIFFLLGVTLIYHTVGSVDIHIIANEITSSPSILAALGLITIGLMLKTALYPMHFWLPAAHSTAPAPVSAALSALVVKASFYILIRLWLGFFQSIDSGVENILGLLGAMAVIWGSIQALRQTRLKMLIAYSTVAQIGYLFVAIPLTTSSGGLAWNAIAYLALSHALAKAAMFMSAGNLLRFGGHDRIADLDRVAQRLPLTATAFALASISIMGLPPSGGFIGKWLLLNEALNQANWAIVFVLIVGGLLSAAYIFKVLGHAFTQAAVPHEPSVVPGKMEWMALLLASGAIIVGFVANPLLEIINTGNPFGSTGVSL